MGAELPGIMLDRGGVKTGSLSKAIGEALIGAARLTASVLEPTQAIGAFGNFFKAFGEVKPSESPGRMAFVLVSISLARCFENVLREIPLKQSLEKSQLAALGSDMLNLLGAKSLSVDADFFLAPAKFSFLKDFARLIHDRLIRPSETPSIVDIENSLRRHYAVALYLAVMARPEVFKPLQDQLFNLTADPARRQVERSNYQAGLVRAFEDMPLMGQEGEKDPVLLGQIYIPLRAWHAQPIDKNITKKTPKSGPQLPDEQKEPAKKVLVEFESHTLDWISKADPANPVMVLSGGPGMGKSSSLRALAARMVLEKHGFPVFIPLQFMEGQTTLEDRIHHVLRERTKDSPLTHDLLSYIDETTLDGPVVLMFDGLDELVLSGEGDDKPLRDLVNKITMYLKTRPSPNGTAKVLAIVAGRIAAADRATSQLEVRDAQLLQFLPLFLTNNEKQAFVKSASAKALDHDQRVDWWRKWQLRRPAHPEKMPEQIEGDDLTPLSREPLLLYFLAFAEVWPKEADQSQLNRNAIYDQVLRRFHQRECEKDHYSLGKRFGDFDSEFEPVLQSLALAAWYDGSTRKGNMVDAFDSLERIDSSLREPFEEHLGKEPAFGASLAFHLKPLDGKNTFEFLHKSFAEYLVSRRFINSIKELPDLLESRVGRARAVETTLSPVKNRAFKPRTCVLRCSGTRLRPRTATKAS